MPEKIVTSNPFPGLRAFEEKEDILFFGREKQVSELLRKLDLFHFLAVIGSSGSGKSSLVKCGLLPSLHHGLMADSGTEWKVCSFRPGNDPLGNLAIALSEKGKAEGTAAVSALMNESILRREGGSLAELYKQASYKKGTNLLILVDQFEEIFRFSKIEREGDEEKNDSAAFVELLLQASEQRECPIYIVFTMRSDFLGDCTEFRGLPEAINNGQFLLPRMTPEEREEAITGPVAVAGANISPRLLDRLLSDVGDNPDHLPILQHALMRTWDAWKRKTPPNPNIDVEDYENIGAMAHALSQHAEEAYDELNTKQKQICQHLFKGLTDCVTDIRGVRRPMQLSEVCKFVDADEKVVKEVIEVFRKPGRAFLMPPAGVPLRPDTVIDISHESLMRVWDRLVQWVAEEYQSVQIYNRLCEASHLYEAGRGSLWRDPELQIGLKWREENNPNEIWASRYNSYFDKAIVFLDYSEQKQQEALLHKEMMQKQRLKRAKRIAGIISGVALLAFILAIYSFALKNEANQQRKIAVSQKTVAEKAREEAQRQKEFAQNQEAKAEKSRAEAIQQKEIAEEEKLKAQVSERNAFLQKSIADHQKSIAEEQRTIADKQKTLAVKNENLARQQQQIAEDQREKATKNEKLAVSQKQIADRLRSLAEARNLAYQSLMLLNDGKTAESRKMALESYKLNAENNGPKQNNDIYNALHYNWLGDIKNKNQALFHSAPVEVIASLGGDLMASGDDNGLVIISKESNGELQNLAKLNVKGSVRAITALGSHLVVITSEGIGYIFNGSGKSWNQESTFKFPGIGKKVYCPAVEEIDVLSSAGIFVFSSKGVETKSFLSDSIQAFVPGSLGNLFVASKNHIYAFKGWDSYPKEACNTFTLNSIVTVLSLSSYGSHLAAGTNNGGIWIAKFNNHNDAIGPNIQRTLSKGCILFEKSQPITLSLHLSSISDLKFNDLPDGNLQLASAGYDQTIRLIDVASAEEGKQTEDIIILRGHAKWIHGLSYSPDKKYLFSAGEDNKIIGWNIGANELAGILKADSK